MKDTLFLLAQAAEPASGSGSPIEALMKSGMLFPLALILMMYFIMIRPHQKQKKALEKRISELKKGDKVITTGGIHGTINHKGDKTISLKVAEGVFMTLEASTVATVLSKDGEKEESKKVEDKK